MAVIKYTAKENTKTGTHSWYAFPVFTGTLSFDELCEEACDDNTYSVEEMRGCVSKFMKIMQRETTRGFRCKLGNDFLTVYPNIQLSVKDELNPDGTVKKAATAKDVKANNAKSRLGCMVSTKFSAQFAANVSWQKVDKNGNTVDDEEEDITQGNGNVDPDSGEQPGGGGTTTPDTPDNPGGGTNTGGDTGGGSTGGDNGGGYDGPDDNGGYNNE